MKKKAIIILIAIILVVAVAAGIFAVMNFNKPKEQKENAVNLSEKVKIGDYVSYNAGKGNTYTSSEEKNGKKDQTFTTTGEEKWRVLSINDDGSINLISESPIRTDDKKAFLIDGATGYANIIDELNNISKIYSNGQNAISTRSMNYEDVINLIGTDKIAEVFNVDLSAVQDEEKVEKCLETLAKQNGTSNNLNYGKEFEITNENNAYIPNKETKEGYKIENNYKFTDSYIYYTYTQRNNLLSDDLCSLLYGSEDQMTGWLATTYQEALTGYGNNSDKTYIEYGVFYTIASLNNPTNCNIGPYQIYFSSNKSPTSGSDSGCGIRPVVTINSTTLALSGEGSMENPYEIDGEVKDGTDFSNSDIDVNLDNNQNISNETENNVIDESNNLGNEVAKNAINEKLTNTDTNVEENLYDGTLKVGNYSLKYGKYNAKTAQYTDDNGVVEYEVTITLRNDGTYILKSSNNDVLKDSSGTYSVKNNVNGLSNVIELSNGSIYAVTANDSFSMPAGAGTVFSYQGK